MMTKYRRRVGPGRWALVKIYDAIADVLFWLVSLSDWLEWQAVNMSYRATEIERGMPSGFIREAGEEWP